MSNKKEEENLTFEISQRFRQERIRLKLNQTDVAKYCEVSERSVGSWESGTTKIPCNALAIMATHEMDYGYVLLGESDNSTLLKTLITKIDELQQLASTAKPK